VKRFWDKVNIKEKNECWEWNGSYFNTGYGCVKFESKSQTVHRVSWKLTNGEIPKDMLILHKCDNIKCCNPNHLFLGTALDNVTDMINKGRFKGRQKKLTNIQIFNIKDMYNNKISQSNIAFKYNVSQMTISKVIRNKY